MSAGTPAVIGGGWATSGGDSDLNSTQSDADQALEALSTTLTVRSRGHVATSGPQTSHHTHTHTTFFHFLFFSS